MPFAAEATTHLMIASRIRLEDRRQTMNRLSLLLLVPVFMAPPVLAHENDFPTQARVEYVYECMNEQGGINYDNMYKCSCSIDEIAERLSYAEYVEADTYTRGQHAMGERGGILREGERAEEMVEEFGEIEIEAARACFLDVDRVVAGETP